MTQLSTCQGIFSTLGEMQLGKCLDCMDLLAGDNTLQCLNRQVGCRRCPKSSLLQGWKVIRGQGKGCSKVCGVQELLDGDLSVRVFGLVAACDTGVHQQRYQEQSHQRLDIAILTFFQGFRKVYVGDHVMQTSKALPHTQQPHSNALFTELALPQAPAGHLLQPSGPVNISAVD